MKISVKKIKKRYYALILLFIIIVYIFWNALSIWNYADVDETRKADVAIVLGAAASDSEVSPVFRERMNQGILLYQNGWVKKMIITGGYGEGNQHSDAYIGYQYAKEQGIPEGDILIEEKSTITEENLENAKAIMDESHYNSALLVSDPLHMKRAMLLARDKGIEAYSSPTTTSMYRGTWVKLKFLVREVFFYVGYKIVSIWR
ncbi:MAG: YdcF family protein [Lachnospiraceae bacterium]|nr:YdcF family protein [Lachnospiraceae bacterium]